MAELKPLELYVHIPFCVRKCRYCDFLSAPADKSTQEAYMLALLREMEKKAPDFKGRSVTSLFYGGGTPSILSAGQIQRMQEELQSLFSFAEDAEVTLECNPGTLSREKLAIYKGCGINRLSIGVQSANDRELEMLGRVHTYSDFLESYDQARKAGFQNINLDLISGLPGQTLLQHEKNVKSLMRLRPEHISVYSLMIEEGTDFFGLYGEDEKARRAGKTPMLLPSEELELAMSRRTKELLESCGYHQYEISNYARGDFECRHNLGYWRRTDYLGLGLGAASLLGNRRFSNTKELPEYLSYDFAPYGEEQLSKKSCMEEFMFLGLREISGIRKADFYRQFGVTVGNVYESALTDMAAKGLLEETEERVFLTEAGLAVSNVVMSAFLLD